MAQSNVDEVLDSGIDQLTAKMFADLVKKNPNKNLVLSAFSALTPEVVGKLSKSEPHERLLRAMNYLNEHPIYGKWQDKFDDAATSNRDFYVSKDNATRLPTMHRQGVYKYFDDDDLDARLLELPYDGWDSTFLIILPKDVEGIAALVEKLKDPSILEKSIESMRFYKLDVYLPKFKIDTTINLRDIIPKGNYKKIFNMTKPLKKKEDTYVGENIQKAFIDINEEGANAAAINPFRGLTGTSFVMYQPHNFDADHPFIFILRNGRTALFTGVFHQ